MGHIGPTVLHGLGVGFLAAKKAVSGSLRPEGHHGVGLLTCYMFGQSI